jgi:hypothetical protein
MQDRIGLTSCFVSAARFLVLIDLYAIIILQHSSFLKQVDCSVESIHMS